MGHRDLAGGGTKPYHCKSSNTPEVTLTFISIWQSKNRLVNIHTEWSKENFIMGSGVGREEKEAQGNIVSFFPPYKCTSVSQVHRHPTDVEELTSCHSMGRRWALRLQQVARDFPMVFDQVLPNHPFSTDFSFQMIKCWIFNGQRQ